jgi:hypothetical protein
MANHYKKPWDRPFLAPANNNKCHPITTGKTLASISRPDNSKYKKYQLTGELIMQDNGIQIVDLLPHSALPTKIWADST